MEGKKEKKPIRFLLYANGCLFASISFGLARINRLFIMVLEMFNDNF